MGRGASPCKRVMQSIEFKQFVNFLFELGFINISVILSTYQIYIYIYLCYTIHKLQFLPSMLIFLSMVF